MKFTLGCIVLLSAHLSFASEQSSRKLRENVSQHRTAYVVTTTFALTTVFGIIGVLPSFFADRSARVLSTNPFVNFSLELRSLSWVIFGPGYFLWEGIRSCLTAGGRVLIEAGIGGPMLRPSRLDSFSAFQCLAQNTYRIMVHGPSSLDYFSYYGPWVGFAGLSGWIYGICFGGIDWMYNDFS